MELPAHFQVEYTLSSITVSVLFISQLSITIPCCYEDFYDTAVIRVMEAGLVKYLSLGLNKQLSVHEIQVVFISRLK